MEIVQNIVCGYTYLAEIRGYNCVYIYLIKQTGDNFWTAMDISTYENDINNNATLMCDTKSMFEVLENRAINDELGFLTMYKVENLVQMRQAITSVQMLGTIDIEKLHNTINSISTLGRDVGGLGSNFIE